MSNNLKKKKKRNKKLTKNKQISKKFVIKTISSKISTFSSSAIGNKFFESFKTCSNEWQFQSDWQLCYLAILILERLQIPLIKLQG